VDATKLIRKKGYTGCIVAVTGNVMDSDVQEFLAAGADMVVLKPMKMAKLDVILQSINDGGGDVMVTRQLLRKIGTL
jgi:CheY-like chemotaxis protein